MHIPKTTKMRKKRGITDETGDETINGIIACRDNGYQYDSRADSKGSGQCEHSMCVQMRSKCYRGSGYYGYSDSDRYRKYI